MHGICLAVLTLVYTSHFVAELGLKRIRRARHVVFVIAALAGATVYLAELVAFYAPKFGSQA